MDIYEYTDYKLYCLNWVEKQPRGGRGQFRKLAQYLRVNPVIISQVLKADRHFSPEQALEVSEFLGLDEMEGDYFQLLLQQERAGTYKLKQQIKKKLQRLKDKSKSVKSRLPKNTELSDQDKAQFYSQWFYSGIRLLTAIEGTQTPQSIAEQFHLPLTKVRQILSFLIEKGLCFEKDDKVLIANRSTHIDSQSPLVTRHHKNWRERAMTKMELQSELDLFFTAPVVIDERTRDEIRTQLLQFIQKTSKKASTAPCEQLVCLNIDFFKV